MKFLTRIRERWQHRHSDPVWADETELLIRPGFEAPTVTMPVPVPPAVEYDERARQQVAALAAQVEAEKAQAAVTEQWGPWDTPSQPPALVPVHEPRPCTPAPCGGVSAIMVSQIPDPDMDITSYSGAHSRAEYMRAISAATGTSTAADETGFWQLPALAPAPPGALPGFHGDKVTAPSEESAA